LISHKCTFDYKKAFECKNKLPSVKFQKVTEI
jgi:hypothetical protein